METVFICRCVCKTFLKIVTDPYFAKLHLTKAPNVDHCLIVQHPSLAGPSLAYISDLQNLSGYEITSDPWRNLNIRPTALQSERCVVLIGSCNGLLYLMYGLDCRSRHYICNPILGELMLLPNHGDGAYHQGAIGFCPKTELYKVIRFHQTNRCEIHTLGTNTWRVIENAPSPYNCGAFDSSFNGNIHWMISGTHNFPNLICSLNLETEKIHYISLPPHIHQDTFNALEGFGVGVLDGLFCIYYFFSEAQMEVSVMKDYGVESSWTKKLTINFEDFLQPPIFVSVCALLNNGDVLLCNNVDYLGYYSFRKGSVKVLLKRIPFKLVLHAPSFISLKDIAGYKDVEVIRRNPHVDPSRVPSLWSDEEVLRLKQAVSRIRYNTMTYPRIAWGPVARKVETRTPAQCKSKWRYMRRLGLV